MLQICAQPVEYGHEIVADTFHPCLAEIEYGFGIVSDQRVARGSAELDVLVNGYALYHLHRESLFFAKTFEMQDFGQSPYFADGYVVNRRDDPVHIRDLPYVPERDAVLFPVPAESHFHNASTSLML